MAVLPVLLGLVVLSARQAEELPVVRAVSPLVDIQDGPRLRKAFWTVTPGLALDVYRAQRSRVPRRVAFVTDTDSIEFEVRPGEVHDFIVSLDGVPCRTRISSLAESARWTGPSEPAGAPEVPLWFGEDGKLHLQARLNDSEPLDFLLDLGADTVVVYPSAAAGGAEVRIDGEIDNAGMGGTERRGTSSDNRLRIGGFEWSHEPVMRIDRQADAADGIAGWPLFEDRCVELVFDDPESGRARLRVHDEAPGDALGWARGDLRLQGTLPHVRAELRPGDPASAVWLAFDTAYNGSVYLTRADAVRCGLPGDLERLGTSRSGGVGGGTITAAVVRLPRLALGGIELRDVPVHVEAEDEGPHHLTSLVGMDVLRRFDARLDFPGDAVWWRPNASFEAPFPRRHGPDLRRIGLLGGGTIAVLLAAVAARRRSSRGRRASG